jgi:ribonuclease R
LERVVCVLAGRGKLLVGEPFFESGVPVVVDRKSAGAARVGDLVVLALGRGRARVETVLGRPDDVAAAVSGLLWETGARRPHRPRPPQPPGADSGRVDLRDLPAITIDPASAKDFDDALTLRREGEGVRVWVHIADVAAFVPAESGLDRDAAERAVSVYVPGEVEPMLPPELSDEQCSLKPDADRRCVTVEIPFDAALEPGRPRFYRSLVRSRARLTYEQAEAILAGEERADGEVLEVLELAERVAGELRRRRYRRGALRIETSEIAFELDGDGGVTAASLAGEPHSHALVEEHMILANEAVGAFLASRRSEALFRVHERPDPQSLELLLTKLEALEIPTPPIPEGLTPGDAARLAARVGNRVTDYVKTSRRGREAFPALVLQALKRARYDPRNLGHSGLASRAYCHFTSPIRRYPDLVCHRALLAEIGAAEAAAAPDDLGELAEYVSGREREAAQIEYQADEICLSWLLDSRLYEQGWDSRFEGEIVGVIGSGLFVRFDDVFEGFLPARRLPGDYFEASPLGTALTGRRGGGRLRLGDEIEVRVERIERNTGKVEVAPV